MELLEKYTNDVAHDYLKNQETADMYISQREAVDLKYRRIINDIYLEHEKREYNLYNECCERKSDDKYLFYVCKSIEYLRNGNEQLFLEDLPNNRDGFADLWQIDVIIFSDFEYFIKPHPKLFDKYTFVNVFIEYIFELSVKGNKKAIDKLFKLNLYSDGGYGEYLEDKVLIFIEKYPAVFIRNWRMIKQYKSSINLGTTLYQYKANDIIQTYKDLSVTGTFDTNTCKEIVSFLEYRKRSL